MVEAAGIETYPALFEKRRRRATFLAISKKGRGFGSNSLSSPVPWRPLESSGVVEK